MLVGNLLAMHQTNLKRLLAYSSIGHFGYLLTGLAALNFVSLQSSMIYLFHLHVRHTGSLWCVCPLYP